MAGLGTTLMGTETADMNRDNYFSSNANTTGAIIPKGWTRDEWCDGGY